MANGVVWIMIDSSGVGGIETHVTTLVAALRQRRINAHIVLLDNHGVHPLLGAWLQAAIPVRIIQGGFAGLVKTLRTDPPTLVHTHGYKAGIYGRCLCTVFGLPVVSTYHAGEPGTGRVKLYNILDSATSFLADSIAVSMPIAKRLLNKCEVVPNFVNVPGTPTSGGKTIAFVGRLSYEKGPDRFIQLASMVPTTQFEVFGDGPSVMFYGAVPSMQTYWNKIGLLCISSRHEGLPMVALEAMSYGVPVAAFNVGALADVIDHQENGYIAADDDMTAMIQLLKAWISLSHGQRQDMSKLARQKVQNTFSSDLVVPRIITIYDRALGRFPSNGKSVDGINKLCTLQ